MINGPMKRLLVAGLVATGCGAFAQAAHSGDQAALLVAGIAQSGIAVGTPGDTVSQWWEVRRADVGTRSNHQADGGDAYMKLGDIKGEYQPSDETQSDAFVKLGDIKGEYTASGKEVEGHVDSSDIALLMSYYGKPQGDVNGDGKSDIGDLALLMDWMGRPRADLLITVQGQLEDSSSLSSEPLAGARKAPSRVDRNGN